MKVLVSPRRVLLLPTASSVTLPYLVSSSDGLASHHIIFNATHNSVTYVSSNTAVLSVILVTTYHVGSVRFDLTFLDTKHVMTLTSL